MKKLLPVCYSKIKVQPFIELAKYKSLFVSDKKIFVIIRGVCALLK
jgi:hypothetical protein